MEPEIVTDCGDITDRIKIDGGWIVRTFISSCDGAGVHTLFISDPQHKWKL